jgi:GxxExxY protein
MEDRKRRENAEGAETLRLGAGSREHLNLVTRGIIASAIEVHRHLGPGLLESAYEECLCFELSQRKYGFQRQVACPVEYKGLKLNCSYRLDLLVEDAVIVEIKALDEILPVHPAQLLTYLKATNKQVGLLINFNVAILKSGIKRMVNQFEDRPIARSVSAPSASQADGNLPPDNPLNPLRVPLRPSVSAGEGRPHPQGRPL